MARIAITRDLLESGIVTLIEDHEVRMPSGARGAFTEEELIEYSRGAEALIPTVGDPVTKRLFEANPQLRIVAQYAVGYDNIDLAAAERRGVVVTHTPGALTDATADLAMALILGVARRLREADRFVREGKFKQWEAKLLLGVGLTGKQLGIVGMGRIGQALARRAKGFGMDVVYYNRNRANPTAERLLSARYVSFQDLLETSDVISLHCPGNPQSHHLINEKSFSRMKPNSILVNTARGTVVDEAALVQALADGQIAGAGLDVYEKEPKVHPGLLKQENVLLAPHIGSATVEARTRMGEMCAEAIQAVFDGEDKIPHRLV